MSKWEHNAENNTEEIFGLDCTVRIERRQQYFIAFVFADWLDEEIRLCATSNTSGGY